MGRLFDLKYYLYNPKKYVTRRITAVIVSLFMISFWGVLLVTFKDDANTRDKTFLAILLISNLLVPIILFYSMHMMGTKKQFVIIGESGIEYHNKEGSFVLKWSDIGSMYLTNNPKYPILQIYSRFLNSDNTISLPSNPFKYKYICKDYIFIEYYQEAYDEIKKYYKEEIKGEYILAISGKYEV